MAHIKRVYIIAEAGVNHNGSTDMAKQLIDAAAAAGADAVKFQTFKANMLATVGASKAKYQIAHAGAGDSQIEMLRKLELDEAAHLELAKHCRNRGIQFLSTPFDTESLNMLVKIMKVPLLKISSGEITNAPFLLSAAGTGKPIILSTGMSTLAEVKTALGILAFGHARKLKKPGCAAFRQALQSAEGQNYLKRKVTLLHCTTEYPTPFSEVNLLAMRAMRKIFNISVGLSDHTTGVAVSTAAVALGASVIEKHFTLDRGLVGPDHKASLEPDELFQLVKSIREVEAALGSPKKRPTQGELSNMKVARKSLVALCDIARGELLTEDNLGCKRPGTGLSPLKYWKLLGKKAARGYRKDDLVAR